MVQRPRSATAGLPPGVEPRRSLSHLAVGLLLAFAVLLGTLLYYAQFSGGVRWLLGVVTLAVLAAIVWSQIQRRTAEPSPLVGPPSTLDRSWRDAHVHRRDDVREEAQPTHAIGPFLGVSGEGRG